MERHLLGGRLANMDLAETPRGEVVRRRPNAHTGGRVYVIGTAEIDVEAPREATDAARLVARHVSPSNLGSGVY